MPLDTELVRWHLEVGRACQDVPSFLRTFCQKLVDVGLPIHRVVFGTFVLHPQVGGAVYRWRPEDEEVRTIELSREFFSNRRSEPSPFEQLETTGQPWRTTPTADHHMPDVVAVHREGYVDLYALPYTMQGEFQGGITFATRQPGGFSDADLERFRNQHTAFCAVLERIIREGVLRRLLHFYLGAGAGERVYRGNVHRGEGTVVPATIWFSDLRGFTSASETMAPDALLTLLNEVFEILIDAVQAHGGEVLKLIGDGMMAIFEADGGAAASVAAARAAQRALAELRGRRRENGLNEPEVGIGLHYGDVMYGNIGGKTRLDFTVIGTAVNRAARLEGLCGKLHQRILVSQVLADRLDLPLEDLGKHPVKGVPEPLQVYALLDG